MATHALLLNADYVPIKPIPWERAMIMLLDEKVDLVIGYADEVIRTVADVWEKPAVVRLRAFHQPRARVRFNRQNLLARDSYTCVYCQARPRRKSRPDLEQLTLDHVVPRAHSVGGQVVLPWSGRRVNVTCWDNIVCACVDCNARKADRTLEAVGMKLRSYPRAPTPIDVLRMHLTRIPIVEEWAAYLPADSEWRGYWTAELDAD